MPPLLRHQPQYRFSDITADVAVRKHEEQIGNLGAYRIRRGLPGQQVFIGMEWWVLDGKTSQETVSFTGWDESKTICSCSAQSSAKTIEDRLCLLGSNGWISSTQTSITTSAITNPVPIFPLASLARRKLQFHEVVSGRIERICQLWLCVTRSHQFLFSHQYHGGPEWLSIDNRVSPTFFAFSGCFNGTFHLWHYNCDQYSFVDDEERFFWPEETVRHADKNLYLHVWLHKFRGIITFHSLKFSFGRMICI